MIELPSDLLERFDPEPDALLDATRVLVNSSMLREIAQADYGQDVDEHLRELKKIKDTGHAPAPIGWEPREVLELTRWSRPEDPQWKPGSTGVRGHIMRAFCCAALLRAAVEPENEGALGHDYYTFGPMMESAAVLGPGVLDAAGRFLSWRIERMGDEQDRPFYAFGLLWLAVVTGRGDLDDIELLILEHWVREETSAWYPYKDGDPWLLARYWEDINQDIWRRLARSLARAAAKRDEGPGRDAVILFAKTMLREARPEGGGGPA